MGTMMMTLWSIVPLELSNVLHCDSGRYEGEDPMMDRERIILIEARKYDCLITQWIRASYKLLMLRMKLTFSLWQVMTFARTIQDDDKLGSVLSGCTPDNVAAALYDTLFKGPYSAHVWKKRGEQASISYDWEGPTLSIQARSSHLFFPDEEDGKTESDLCYIGTTTIYQGDHNGKVVADERLRDVDAGNLILLHSTRANL